MGTLELIATEDRPRAVQDKRKALGKGYATMRTIPCCGRMGPASQPVSPLPSSWGRINSPRH
jgi:hypothetical protein